jgi:hypothetical protein
VLCWYVAQATREAVTKLMVAEDLTVDRCLFRPADAGALRRCRVEDAVYDEWLCLTSLSAGDDSDAFKVQAVKQLLVEYPLVTKLRVSFPELLCCAVLCCAVLCCAVLCCAVLCCAVLCCAVLCYRAVILCCHVLFCV